MKIILRLSMAALAGLVWVSPAAADPRVVRCLVRDAHGNARTAYVRVADRRILYPRVVQQCARPGGGIGYRQAMSPARRPDGAYGYHHGAAGRRFSRGDNRYPDYYRPLGNYGVDAILRNDQRSSGYPSYYRPGGNYGVDAMLSRGNHGHGGFSRGNFPRPVASPMGPAPRPMGAMRPMGRKR